MKTTHLILLKDYQITYFKQFAPSFDEEELEFRGAAQKKDTSFDHAFGTKIQHEWFVTDLEVKIGAGWVWLLKDGEYGASIHPFEQGQIEEIVDSLKE